MAVKKCSMNFIKVKLHDLFLTTDYMIPKSEHLEDYDITLGIDISKLPKTSSIDITYH